MPKALILVETQAKAATLSALASPDYTVLATGGPLRDLPANRLGFPLEGPYELAFEVPEARRGTVEELAAAARECSAVYLAMDPDAEGEMAAWHVREVLKPLLPEKTAFKRARITELTLRGLRQALRYAGIVDMDLVESQKARRALDRLVAFGLAPHLWRNVEKGVSLGRMQSVAFRLVCSREHERETTKPIARWRYAIRAVGSAEPETPVFFRLVDADGTPMVITDKERTPVIKTAISGAAVTVDTVRRESVLDEPPPPFTTETLLADASSVLGLAPARTQLLAQKLFEGVDFGQGPVGLITFPRTAESGVSAPALADAQAVIRKHFGEAYLRKDEAAPVTLGRPEAIRPTIPSLLPESLKGKLEPAELQLYLLIWRRFIASQMAPARIERSIGVVDALAADGFSVHRLHATAEAATFRGHRLLTATITPKPDDPFPPDVPAERLPPLAPGETLQSLECLEDSVPAEPLRRYTEAEFVHTLAATGFGRPATFASLVGSLYQRKFAERQARQIVPTGLGRKAVVWLFSMFPGLLSETFAALVENAIDDIAAGKGTASDLIGKFIGRFHRIWSGETAEKRASPEQVATVFQALDTIVNWDSTNVRSSPDAVPGEDEERVEDLREAAESTADGSLSEAEFEELLKIFLRYRPQIPTYVETVKKLERYDLLELPDTAPDARIIQMKMEWVDKVPLSPESRRFVDSLQKQIESGRHLTEAQVRVLDEILAAQALRIEGLTQEILDEMGIVARTQADLDSIQRLLDALNSVTEWRPPSQRGKRTYDDASFTASVREQFSRRGDLSPAQLSAVKRMVARYHDKIACYAEIAPIYGLPPEGLPQPNLFGRRGRKKKTEETPSDDIQPPAHNPPSIDAPNYDDL